ncbi:methyltransferase domain-containing protein [Thermodesulfobacteriota bacterium]
MNKARIQDKMKEAIACYSDAFVTIPQRGDAFNRLGNTLNSQGEHEVALAAFEQALAINPDHAGAYSNLGNTLNALGRTEEAAWAYFSSLQKDPGNSTARHMFSALTGQPSDRPPTKYIKDLFDQYANRFDFHLVNRLRYQVPARLFRVVKRVCGESTRFENVVDLGCGTGLAGMFFKQMSKHIIGVDLSGKMLEKAGEKKIYHELIQRELVHYLSSTDRKFDLFVAADVFAYVGELSELFTKVRDCSQAGACMAFSTEKCMGKDFKLRSAGRYAHSRGYIETLADEHGFKVESCSAVDVRRESHRWVSGDLFVLKSLA